MIMFDGNMIIFVSFIVCIFPHLSVMIYLSKGVVGKNINIINGRVMVLCNSVVYIIIHALVFYLYSYYYVYIYIYIYMNKLYRV